jgi:hypothetical protein
MPAKVKKSTAVKIAGVAYVLLFASAGLGGLENRDKDNKCRGSERWEQKVLVDDKAGKVETTLKDATIAQMNAKNTAGISIGNSTERMDMEEQVYTIHNCFITNAFRESDNDFHLVIEDGNKNNPHHMIAEIPDPDCAVTGNSDFAEDFKKARETFLKYQDVYHQYKWDVTGVLFVDKKHPKIPTGNGPNNVELHPVIKLVKVGKKFPYPSP